MRAQKLQTEIRREQIAQAALDLIGTHGLQALSIASVAERVGLVPSGIYRHFKSKDDLLSATLNLIGKRLLNNVESVRRETPDALERLRVLLMREIRLLLENQAIPRVVFSESIFSDSVDRKARVRAVITGYFQEVEKIVQEGQRKGRLRADVDPLTVVLMFKGMVLSAMVLWKVTGGSVDLVRQAEAAWELFRAAVSKAP
ncbi:MAG: TetR/AcrR family transcriptional regulator [Deltaproteobacteria bacterium]|nr:TetR/AcrR family transcriptional regulator [Deltaproteobacteria bacterium]MBW1925364.1 TetR/AcrR family transcriptional regulator [Deltaproteobacteria bacterium]MBW2007498.1 TetR/AcrR family transcriptional regulator [Deltaproteobacteria bacterium]MBW2104126.1 TetR/AcrR family transcriptional regulator [Deltaproteobacteria bacterium]